MRALQVITVETVLISVLNAFAETLLEVKEKNKTFWEMQSDSSIQLQSHSCSEFKSIKTGRIYFIQARSRPSHKWPICRDCPQPAKNVTNAVQTISL